MTPHPQRCLHSHICKWNKDNYQDCIDTDCASHRYTYSTHQSEREKVLKEVRENYVKYNDIPCPELAEKYGHACDSEYCGMCILDFVLEELREQGGEQR